MTTSDRRPLIDLLVLCLVGLCAPLASAQPNIIILLTDDQGWADIGYNNPKVYSPNLDALAREGTVFNQHYVMPQCTPTRVALITGRYPSRFGGHAQQASNQPAFPVDTPTLSQYLHDAGYRTALAGKWHLGSDPANGPNHFGFEQSYGSLTGAVGMYDHRYRPGEFEHTWHRNHKPIEGADNGVHATDLVTDEAIRFIASKDARPFFLYVPFHAVHTPLDERGRFTDAPTKLDPDDPARWLHEDDIPWFHDPEGLIQRESDAEKRLLLAAIHHLDHAIGRIVQTLERTGHRDNTLILFSSDNGPQGSWGGNAYPDDLKLTDFNQPLPFRGKKLDVYEGGIRVPGFANWPGKVRAGEVEDALHIVDWFPTLADIVGRPTDVDFDGVSLAPLLLEARPLEQRDLYWTWNQAPNRWALRRGQWKIVRYASQPPQAPTDWNLYNLTEDPRESRDLAAEHPEVLEALHARYMALRKKDAAP